MAIPVGRMRYTYKNYIDHSEYRKKRKKNEKDTPVFAAINSPVLRTSDGKQYNRY